MLHTNKDKTLKTILESNPSLTKIRSLSCNKTEIMINGQRVGIVQGFVNLDSTPSCGLIELRERWFSLQ